MGTYFAARLIPAAVGFYFLVRTVHIMHAGTAKALFAGYRMLFEAVSIITEQ
ncbi:hypothetical Protein YC6258_02967 [Gynuella sunshinyii YC6258]|uniref:Uncharacterized protein n=1 Tax=Gynuella sunshinyii YC6258 TaxID=1445510 RepID=A0A0C5V6B7_9GAMM|nr:hypothetical Protein YC6258_02967 [Gynuella sunshinyii YC6258]